MKQKRTALVKSYVTDDNKELLQSACSAMHKSVSDVLNECTIVIIRNHLDAKPKRKDIPPFGGGARPKPSENKAHFFIRPSYGVVPGFMINESTGATSWGSGIESIGRAFVQYTLQPWLRKIEQELNRKLFPRDTGKFVEFYRDALTEGDLAAQGTYFRIALGGPGAGDGHMSINEVRRIKRLAPVPGGDEVYRAPRDTGKPANKSATEEPPAP